MANEIRVIAKDFNGEVFTDKEVAFQLAGNGTTIGTGQPVTLRAARKMIYSYWDKIFIDIANAASEEAKDALLDESVSVFFGKETLMLLLLQEKCEGIRFYFCINHEGKQSLVLVGIEAEANDLNLPDGVDSIAEFNLSDEIKVMLDEVGGPRKFRQYLSEEFVDDPVGKALKGFLATR